MAPLSGRNSATAIGDSGSFSAEVKRSVSSIGVGVVGMGVSWGSGLRLYFH